MPCPTDLTRGPSPLSTSTALASTPARWRLSRLMVEPAVRALCRTFPNAVEASASGGVITTMATSGASFVGSGTLASKPSGPRCVLRQPGFGTVNCNAGAKPSGERYVPGASTRSLFPVSRTLGGSLPASDVGGLDEVSAGALGDDEHPALPTSVSPTTAIRDALTRPPRIRSPRVDDLSR